MTKNFFYFKKLFYANFFKTNFGFENLHKKFWHKIMRIVFVPKNFLTLKSFFTPKLWPKINIWSKITKN